MALRFHNSLTRSTEEFQPIVPGKVGLYTCGPTVYNFAHIGNFRAYMFEDLLKRTLKFCGLQVKHVMNFTDVDDKTIRSSIQQGLKLNDFTRIYKDGFLADIKELRIEPADVYPEATAHIGEMIKMIKTLVEKGHAYQAEDKSVYFSIASFPGYGQLANLQPDQMRSSGRVKNDEYAKESVADFALWKAWDEADGDVFWESPWGRGRPGWHIECSAMAGKHLGRHFDIHCGGVDNLFPHHEDEIAQSECANGCKYVNVWLHCAHLVVDGQKMSKSVGNFYTIRDVLHKGYSGRVARWVLLGAHYRQSLNFSFQACEDAWATLRRLDDFLVRVKETASAPDAGLEAAAARCQEALAAFQAGLEDDLNASAASAALFDLVRDVNRMIDHGQFAGAAARQVLDTLRRMDTVFAVLDVDREEEAPAEVLKLVDERQAARKAKDFARSDAIRDQLKALGWVIEDTPKGVRVKRG
jgi:cysteinyl-tRNA synthetase